LRRVLTALADVREHFLSMDLPTAVATRGAASSEGASGHDPLLGGTAHAGDALEIGVVVEHDQPGVLGRGRDDQVGDRDPVLAGPGEFVLEVDGRGHDGGSDGGGVQGAALFEHLLVVAEATGAVENFEVDDGAGGNPSLVY
jgi:hypothetical protein